jgi:hypothetical protein
MSASHNEEADFAASELARIFVGTPGLCYANGPRPAGLSAAATYEPSSTAWPKADGLVVLLEGGPQQEQRHIAVEYKRQQEGIHGLLTGLGQAHAYLHKGYNGAALVVPRAYPTLSDAATYLTGVLDAYSGHDSIGVFSYDEPDSRSPKPFEGRLHCIRPFTVTAVRSGVATLAGTPKTQWVHMREGSTTRDGFFRFIQTAKRVTSGGDSPVITLRRELLAAVARVSPQADPLKFLSSTSDDKLLSRIWREFWFEWLATPSVLTPWMRDDTGYRVPQAATRVWKDDGSGPSLLFEGRVSSLKNVLVDRLNRGLLTEGAAWDAFVIGLAREGGGRTQGVSQRAHSYREDLDSALVQLGLIEPDGQPTDIGYHYAAVCERYGGANSQAAKEFVGAALLQNGHYGSFIHYVYRLSEQTFAANPLAYTELCDGLPTFTENSYWTYLSDIADHLSNELKVMRRVGTRERPRERTTFQVELTLLRNYGFVSTDRYRLGVGIPIDWIKVQEALSRSL